MRISYSDEESFPGEFNLWQANCARSLQGKQGQKVLRELEVALLALPTKRLIANELDNGTDCCAIGALVRHKALDPETDIGADPEIDMEEVGVECRMPRLVAWKVVEVNDLDDEYRWVGNTRVRYTPEERYAAVLQWVQRQLGSDPAPRPSVQETDKQ